MTAYINVKQTLKTLNILFFYAVILTEFLY